MLGCQCLGASAWVSVLKCQRLGNQRVQVSVFDARPNHRTHARGPERINMPADSRAGFCLRIGTKIARYLVGHLNQFVDSHKTVVSSAPKLGSVQAKLPTPSWHLFRGIGWRRNAGERNIFIVEFHLPVRRAVGASYLYSGHFVFRAVRRPV